MPARYIVRAMARMNATHKPGEKAPVSGTYYCYICSQRGMESTCEIQEGQVFLACPKCLERKVPEWDMTWKSQTDRPGTRASRIPTLWPGSLAKPS